MPLPDDELATLLALLREEEWLQGRLADDDVSQAVSQQTEAHVTLYAMLCAAEDRHGASAAALRLAWLQGAGAMLAVIRERCR